MIIEVKKLIIRKQYEGNFAFTYSPKQESMLLPLCHFDGDVKVEGTYEIYEDDTVGITFTISYTIKGQCSYCLEDAQKLIQFTSDVLFVLDKDDKDNYYYDGKNLDLTSAVEDALLISQPDVLLCKVGCNGIKLN
jgi:uncharacterized metal-binding protein YceD (DUF177 family)